MRSMYDDDFVVAIPDEYSSRAVQEQFFKDGVGWSNRGPIYLDCTKAYGSEAAIRYHSRLRILRRATTQYYETCGFTIVQANEFAQGLIQAMMITPRTQ